MQIPYELQEGSLVAGTYKVFEMYPKNKFNEPITLTGAKVFFSVSEYINEGDPIVSKAGTVAAEKVTAELTSEESANMNGKYIYQFTVIDQDGPTYCARGLLTVWKNINPDVLAQ